MLVRGLIHWRGCLIPICKGVKLLRPLILHIVNGLEFGKHSLLLPSIQLSEVVSLHPVLFFLFTLLLLFLVPFILPFIVIEQAIHLKLPYLSSLILTRAAILTI